MENPRSTHGALNRFNRFRSFPRLDTDQTKAAAKPPTPEKTEGVWKVMPSRSSTKTAWDEWSRPPGAVTAALIREGKLERSGRFVAGDSGRESPATLFFNPFCNLPDPGFRPSRKQDQRQVLGAGSKNAHHPGMSSDNDQEFLQLAETLMQDLLARLDTLDPDELEADSAAGVVKMTFADGGICVLNRQTAAHQMWLAEGATAWHFEREPATGTWLDTKGRGTLNAVLSEVISRRLGRTIEL
jgi:CyaY protein